MANELMERGRTAKHNKDLKSAANFYESAYKIRLKHFGLDHIDTVIALKKYKVAETLMNSSHDLDEPLSSKRLNKTTVLSNMSDIEQQQPKQQKHNKERGNKQRILEMRNEGRKQRNKLSSKSRSHDKGSSSNDTYYSNDSTRNYDNTDGGEFYFDDIYGQR